MFTIDADMCIHLTRGDVAVIDLGARAAEGVWHTFQAGDVVRFRVTEKKRCDMVVLQKDFVVAASSPSVEITLTSEDTRIGEVIHKPKDYWYEVEVNPETAPQTIIGYDKSGPKVFRLYPEGDDK